MFNPANPPRFSLSIEGVEHVLHGRYVHLPANWTPSKGLLVSKPAPNRRLVFSNKPQQGYPE